MIHHHLLWFLLVQTQFRKKKRSIIAETLPNRGRESIILESYVVGATGPSNSLPATFHRVYLPTAGLHVPGSGRASIRLFPRLFPPSILWFRLVSPVEIRRMREIQRETFVQGHVTRSQDGGRWRRIGGVVEGGGWKGDDWIIDREFRRNL